MRILTLVAGIIGLVVTVGLVMVSGVGEVWQAVATAGWATAAVLGLRYAAVVVAAAGWYWLIPAGERPSLSRLSALRAVREAINGFLPVAQVGGDIVGARLLRLSGVEASTARASVVADVMVQVVTQIAFTAVGLGVLVLLGGDPVIVRTVSFALLAALLLPAGFWLAQRPAVRRFVARHVRFRFSGRLGGLMAQLRLVWERLLGISASRGDVAVSTTIHLALWFFGVLEVWVVLAAMGYSVTYAEALVIESIGQAVKGAAFAVPGALGVQEGGFIALGAIFGIPVDASLALSLIKRVADLGVGVPGLLAWQMIEGRNVLRRNPAPDSSQSDPGPGLSER